MDLFSDINAEGTTVIIVTHDAKVAVRSERVMFMRDGTIVSDLKFPEFDGANLDDGIETVTLKMRDIGI